MALSEDKQKFLIIGGGVALIGYILLRSKKAKAEEVVKVSPDEIVPVPAAGGGLPTPEVGARKDASGVVIAGPSTEIVVVGEVKMHTVERDESWTNLASRAYGDFRYWPFLWDYNRSESTQFNDPDRLIRGATLKIPALPALTPAQKAELFKRADLHRAYWRCKARGGRDCKMDPIVFTRTVI